MQDRFKFRGLTKNNEWCYGSLLYYAGDAQIWEQDGKNYIVNPETVGQCTGLKDKNGKLIYEGDIVRDINIPSYFYIVVWFKGGFYLKSTVSNSFLMFDTTQQEVIGNIYENPELLEG
jgi:uncharacterized phage protein (TIGR01671 family)